MRQPCCEDKDAGHCTCRRTSERIESDGRLPQACRQRFNDGEL